MSLPNHSFCSAHASAFGSEGGVWIAWSNDLGATVSFACCWYLFFKVLTLDSSTPILAISFCASTSALISPASLALNNYALAASKPVLILPSMAFT